MKSKTIKLQDGDAAIVLNKNCESFALHEDVENLDGEIGENTYLLMALILATQNSKLITKILDNAEKILKDKDFNEVFFTKEKTKKGKK